MIKRVLIIGGYGNFGAHIVQSLCQESYLQLIVAGRSADKAASLINSLGQTPNPVLTHIFDYHTELDDALTHLKPDIVVHTSGPFQEQGYHVANACIAHGCHYIDLADGRDFVAGIGTLNTDAQKAGITVISGASSVPCLTAAVIDHFLPDFGTLTEIDYGISTAQHTNTGLATTAAIMGYVGKPFLTLKDGRMSRVYGWQDLHPQTYPEIGTRYLGNCDVPDLALFPARYPDLKTIRFYAGSELAFLHIGLWGLSWLCRVGIIRNLNTWADRLLNISRWFDRFGSGTSAFHMILRGTDKNGNRKQKNFYLVARDSHGPFIPSTPAILLTKMLAQDETIKRGAFPCLGFISLDAYLDALRPLHIKSYYSA